MKWIFGYIFFMNIMTYATFALDKKRARKGKWRIPEKRLLLLTFLGGAIGGWRGMKDYYHKINKKSFRILVPLFTVMQMGGIYYLIFQIQDPIQENIVLLIGAIFLHLLLFSLTRLFRR